MPRFERKAIVERFQDMIRRGEPIIGGGAGTGISAKCEEAGGIDLIIVYNSGRYRMAGRASSAGLLAYGNANEIVKEMAVEVLPVCKKTPVIAGVNGTDPFVIMPALIDGFGNWFRKQCIAAGLSDECRAHGLRKAIARRAAELEATQQQLKAIGGWEQDAEVTTYTKGADQARMGAAILNRIIEWEQGQ